MATYYNLTTDFYNGVQTKDDNPEHIQTPPRQGGQTFTNDPNVNQGTGPPGIPPLEGDERHEDITTQNQGTLPFDGLPPIGSKKEVFESVLNGTEFPGQLDIPAGEGSREWELRRRWIVTASRLSKEKEKEQFLAPLGYHIVEYLKQVRARPNHDVNLLPICCACGSRTGYRRDGMAGSGRINLQFTAQSCKKKKNLLGIMRDQFKLTLDRYNSVEEGHLAQSVVWNTAQLTDGYERPQKELTEVQLYVPKGIKRTIPTEAAFFPVAVKKARELRGDPPEESIVEPKANVEHGQQDQLIADANWLEKAERLGSTESKKDGGSNTPGPEQHKRKLKQRQEGELMVWAKNMNGQVQNWQSLYRTNQEDKMPMQITGIQPQPASNVAGHSQHQRQQPFTCLNAKQVAKSRRKDRQKNRRKETVEPHYPTETQKQPQSPGSPGQRR
jgi:hypothetical protein